MKRRSFLKNMPLAVVPFFSNKLFAAPMSLTQEEAFALNAAIGEDRVLVIVQLDGGNDGLNTVLPLDQYSNLSIHRSNVLIPDTQALVLGNHQTGLHPAMTGMKSLFDQNKLCIIQGVSYANPNQSHFRSSDIMNMGVDANQISDSGWAGRYLQYAFPGYPNGYPTTNMPDPLSIQIGYNAALGLMGHEVTTAQLINPWFNGGITQLQSFVNTTTPSNYAGQELEYLRNQQAYADQYANAINNAWNAGTNTQTYPAAPPGTWSNLGNQLRIVARLIKGGLKTKIYWVRQSGYDTHDNQVDSGNKTQGAHALLLKELSDSLATFMTDITALGLEERIMGMTFSEFGRRVISNASGGTDHGAAGPMFVFGKYVNPTVVGANAIIPPTANWTTNVPTQFDYRQVYGAMLQGWFCVPNSDLNSIVGNSTPPAPATNTSCLTALPIELMRYNVAKANASDAHIEWVTAMEQNVSSFEVQRSTDGTSYKKVETVRAKGHSHEPTSYDVLDRNLPLEKYSLYYYRIRVIENDGTEYFTEVKTVRFERKSTKFGAEVYPNPTQDGILQVQIQGNEKGYQSIDISVNDYLGRSIYSEIFYEVNPNTPVQVRIGDILTDGVYFMTIKHNSASVTKRVVVQR